MIKFDKCLFFTNHELDESKGISKKIISQVSAIREQGIQTFLLSYKEINNHQQVLLDGHFFFDLGKKIERHIYKNGVFYNYLINFLKKEKIDCLYIRYTQFVDIYFLIFLKKAHHLNCKILMEIPTYPYDGEFPNDSLKSIILKWKDIILRRFFHNYVDRIVTFSTDKVIFGIPCINISNAVDADSIKIINKKNNSRHEITLIGVANVNFWHGYDRIIEGLRIYYSENVSTPVRFLIVGKGNPKVYEQLKNMIYKYGLHKFVKLMGPKSGSELDELFNVSDIAIGSLGSHRKKIIETKTLKNVEYAMRGLPIVYSENNNDFDSQTYIYKAEANENPINIHDIVEFVNELKFDPQAIRLSVSHLTWRQQMKEVFIKYK